jgi:DNA-binding MarR family transcriptional regulator
VKRPQADPDLLKIQEFADLVAASARSARQHERVVRAAGVPVTGASLEALRLVARHGPIAVSEVARRLRVGQSTASRQLRPLEERGLVVRSGDPADARVARLSTSDAGRAVLARVREVSLNDFDVALGDWEPADRKLLAELLERFRKALLEARTDETGWSVPARKGVR